MDRHVRPLDLVDDDIVVIVATVSSNDDVSVGDDFGDDWLNTAEQGNGRYKRNFGKDHREFHRDDRRGDEKAREVQKISPGLQIFIKCLSLAMSHDSSFYNIFCLIIHL